MDLEQARYLDYAGLNQYLLKVGGQGALLVAREQANAKAIAWLRDRGAVPTLAAVLAYGTDLPDGVVALDAAEPDDPDRL